MASGSGTPPSARCRKHLETREELIALAHIWLKRAAKLEVDVLKQQKGKYLDERGNTSMSVDKKQPYQLRRATKRKRMLLGETLAEEAAPSFF